MDSQQKYIESFSANQGNLCHTLLCWLYCHILPVALYVSWESWLFVSMDNMQSMMCANSCRIHCDPRFFPEDSFGLQVLSLPVNA